MPVQACCCSRCKWCTPEWLYIPDYASNKFDIDSVMTDGLTASNGGTPPTYWTDAWSGFVDLYHDSAPTAETCGQTTTNYEEAGFIGSYAGNDGTSIINPMSGWGGNEFDEYFTTRPIEPSNNPDCACKDPATNQGCTLTFTIEYYNFALPAEDEAYHSISWQGQLQCRNDGGSMTFTRTSGFDTRSSVTLRNTQSLPVSSATIAAAGATTTFDINSVASDLPYVVANIQSMAAWITINSPVANYTGSETVSYTVAANMTGLPRSGTIQINCLTFTVNQGA